MTPDKSNLEQRTRLALDAIQASVGTEAGEYGADLFCTHHLEELDSSIWKSLFETDKPSSAQVLDSLEVSPHWATGGEGDLDRIDFALPGGVSDCVLCVEFNAQGEVEDISMES